jgi:hypothetical protein
MPSVRDLFFQYSGVRRHKEVTIQGFGSFRIQSVFDEEQRQASAKSADPETGEIDRRYYFADMAIATIVDEDGDAEFGEIDREKLAKMDFAVTSKVLHEILNHCHIGEFAKDTADLKKNSQPTTASMSV